MRWVQPMKQLFRSKAAMGMGMGGAITAVAATTTAGGIIAIGGDFHLGSTAWRLGDIAEELARLRYVNQRDAKFSPASVQSIMLAKLALDEGTDYERAFRSCISTNFDGLLCSGLHSAR
jgi:hypothetical protein